MLIYAICIVLGLMALFLPVSSQLVAFVALTGATGLVFFVLTRRSVDESSRAAGAKAKAKATAMATAKPKPAAEPPAADGDALATRDPALFPPGGR